MTARILVVDDVSQNVKLLQAKLGQEYYEVLTASDGYKALEVLESNDVDIVLLDVMMPGMDGFETCKRIKLNPKTSHIPVVMVTALSDIADRLRGLESGADDFLTKPINSTALFARIRSLVRLKVMVDQLRLRQESGMEFGMGGEAHSIYGEAITDPKVLIINDDITESEPIAAQLRSLGYEADVLAEAGTVITALQAKPYDVLLLSSHVAGVDGLRICSQVRSHQLVRSIPILLLSEEDQMTYLVKALEVGVNDYVISPPEMNELVARCKILIRRKRFQDQLRTNYQQSMSMAVTDGLTGAFNRRYFDAHSALLFKQSRETSKPLCMVMIDIDHFKAINDTHGHSAGDEILKEVSKRIMSSLRITDFLARYGGEEFVVVLPDTILSNAKIVTDRIHHSIRSAPVVTSAGISVTITASLGLAMIANDTPDAPALLNHADTALYQAKDSGRDRVVISGSPPTP